MIRAVIVLLTASGCAFGYRGGGTVIVDQRGEGGVTAGTGLSFGLKTGDTHGVVATIDAGLGPGFPDAGGLVTAASGLDYIEQEVFGSSLGVRAGLRGQYLGWFKDSRFLRHAFGPGVALTLLVGLDREHFAGHEKMGGGSTRWDSLAIEFQTYYLPEWDRSPPAVLFSIGLSYAVDGVAEFF